MSKKYNCILVEDETRSLNLMTKLIGQVGELELSGAFQDPGEALEFALQNTPDLFILDIKMPRIDGLQFVDRLKEGGILRPFIFTTAYDEYVIEALRKSAVDYLMKPVSLQDLKEAIGRFLSREAANRISGADSRLKKMKEEIIRFNFKTGFELVRKKDIICLEADSNYTRVVLTEDRQLTVSQNIGRFVYLVDEAGFIKIHRSYLVNPEYIRRINRVRKTCTLGHNGFEINVSISPQGMRELEKHFRS